MFELVCILFETKFHRYNPLPKGLLIFMNSYQIELLIYCFTEIYRTWICIKISSDKSEKPKIRQLNMLGEPFC